MLTADFCNGCKVNDMEGIKSQGLAVQDVSTTCWGRTVDAGQAMDPDTHLPSSPQVAKKLIQTFAEQIFHTGFIHSDPHPGNGRKAPRVGSQRGGWS